MGNTAISVENLYKRYRIGVQKVHYRTLRESINEKLSRFAKNNEDNPAYFWALKDINFKVEKGESLGIIGRNGAGKSTLLKILSRITKPTKGRAVLDGRVGSLLEVGTGFHPELTGRENIYLNGAILGMKRAEIDRKFDEIVNFSGIETFLETPVKRFSSGMYVRLAFSVAAHLEPEILLVDEVLAVGDAEFQKKCLGKMGDVASEGRTVIFISHNMGQINKLCNRAILMEGGEIFHDDFAEQTIRVYLDRINTFEPAQMKKELKSKILNITNCKIFGSNNNVGVETGKPFAIEIDYELIHNLEKIGFILNIINMQGEMIFATNSQPIGGLDLHPKIGENKILVQFKDCMLAGGEYILGVGVKNIPHKTIIPVTPIVNFEVKPNDFYGNGVMITQKYGTILLDHDWMTL